ncbi:DDE superfamily endonuclease [Pseudonocardia thermophila]|uniref:DDE superfamily endonuclease n=2 Tax=Pseudonocardia thermophila TaxID=1848 RepID=A0A1M7BHL5_PSETH|nr:transposase family protein [Pseudonocardia thermophila]SHL54502.1 DDE superfamily endonuclease [Pseudonocardia thermophila]
MTGLDDGQLTDLVARVHEVCGERFVSRGRPIALGLFRSVAMVVCLLRKNLTQDLAGAVFGVSQPTVSRRWDLLRPVIGDVLAAVRPTPSEVAGRGTVLVDGTVCPTWDWQEIPDLYSTKVGFPGMNLQVAATLDGDLVAVGEIPVHGARHDAHAFAASRLADVLRDFPSVADLGYVGVEDIGTVPYKRLPGIDLDPSQIEFNTDLSRMRAAVEHAIAHLKTWRMLSEEGGRYRAPISKYASVVKAIIGLFFFAAYE